MVKNRKRRLLCLTVLLTTLITFFSASATPVLAADEPVKFKNVVLSVYPEYDDPLALGYPTVLVMLEGQLDGAIPPVPVRFLVPTGAAMYSAGSGPRTSYQRGESLELGKPSDIAGWDEVSYTLQTDNFVVEYYAAIPTSPDRDFSVEFMPLFDINGLTALVQEPRQATDFNVAARGQAVTQSPFKDDGFNVQRYSLGSLKSGESISFNITYTRNTLSPSLAIAQGPSSTGLLIIFGVVMGVLLLVVLYQVRKNSASRRRIRGRVSSKQPARKSAGERFCTQCGAKLGKSERFCAQCGTKQSP